MSRTHKDLRKVACIGAWYPVCVLFTVAYAGQKDYFHCTETNKKFFRIDKSCLTPDGNKNSSTKYDITEKKHRSNALGMESDKDVVSLIGTEEYFIGSIGASMVEGTMVDVRTTEDAIKFIANKLKLRRARSSIEMKEHDALDFLTNSFIAHIPRSDGSMFMKAVYLSLMIRRLIETEIGIYSEDDRDFYGNKRIELAGSMLALLFEDLFYLWEIGL